MTTSAGTLAFRVDDVAAQLEQSLATIEWAVALVPSRWTHHLPDVYPEDAWSVAMNLAHLVIYEECIATPILESLAAGGDGEGVVRSHIEAWFLHDAEAIADQPLDALMGRLRRARLRQVDVVRSLDDQALNAPRCTLWTRTHGGVAHSAGWLAAKTFQHT